MLWVTKLDSRAFSWIISYRHVNALSSWFRECLHNWCWPWSSKPSGGLNKAPSGFNSHTFPLYNQALDTELGTSKGISICHGNKTKQKHLPRINTELHGNKTKNNHGRLNKRGQVSFSALNIFCSWFRLTAEKET